MATPSAFKGAIAAGGSTRPAPSSARASSAAGDDADLKRSVSIFATVAYPNLVEVSTLDGKYSVLAIVDPDDPNLKDLRDLILDHAQAKSGKRAFPPGWHNPVRDGDEVKPNGGFAFAHEAFRGKTVLRAKTAFPPKTVWGSRKVPCDPGEIEGGDCCIVAVGAYSFDKGGSRGVGLSLNGLWLVSKGTVKIERGDSADFSSFDTSGINFMDDGGEPEA